MAHRYARPVAIGLALLAGSGATAPTASAGDDPFVTVEQRTTTNGNTAWDYLAGGITFQKSGQLSPISTHRRASDPTSCGLWSKWRLYNRIPSTGERFYAVRIYDSCHGDMYIPTADPKCANDGQTGSAEQPSYCADVLPGHLVAGYDPSDCMAMSSQWVVLNAAITPASYDAATGAVLSAQTSFVSNFEEQLRELSCTNIIAWEVVGWSYHWSDGAVDTRPGSGQQPGTDTHPVAPDPQPQPTGSTPASVIAIAHLHIRGQAFDFDAAGNLVTTNRDAFVDISNKASTGATGSAPVYTPPQLQAGAIPVAQLGNGSIPPFNPGAASLHHMDTIRGRLLDVYPRALVVIPGTESINGVVVGQSTTTTLSWTYTGADTDAPPAQATRTGVVSSSTQPLHLQWNHAEHLGPHREPVDETVPITFAVRSTYPDGHTEDTTVSDSLSITIYYIGLNYNG